MTKKENTRIINELSSAYESLCESQLAYQNDMKELKEELAKNPLDWNCDAIDNLSRCTKERAEEVLSIKAKIDELEELRNKH